MVTNFKKKIENLNYSLLKLWVLLIQIAIADVLTSSYKTPTLDIGLTNNAYCKGAYFKKLLHVECKRRTFYTVYLHNYDHFYKVHNSKIQKQKYLHLVKVRTVFWKFPVNNRIFIDNNCFNCQDDRLVVVR